MKLLLIFPVTLLSIADCLVVIPSCTRVRGVTTKHNVMLPATPLEERNEIISRRLEDRPPGMRIEEKILQWEQRAQLRPVPPDEVIIPQIQEHMISKLTNPIARARTYADKHILNSIGAARQCYSALAAPVPFSPPPPA